METLIPATNFRTSTSLKAFSTFFFLLLGISQFNTATPQQRTLVVKDTTASTFIIHPDFPESVTVVMYSYLQNLVISSSIDVLDTSFDSKNGEYTITLRPNTAHRLTIEYPGFSAFDLHIPPMETGTTRFYSVEPPIPFISGKLVIETTPSDATIYVQGISMKQGSVYLDLVPGHYSIHIIRDGYEPVDFFAEIGFNDFNIQRRSLARSKQPLTVTSNVEGAKVFFQGIEVGLTPLTDLIVDQGIAEIRVESPGYKPFVGKVDIRSDSLNHVEAILESHINVLPSTSSYVQNTSVSIENNVLHILYDLASEIKRYKVDVAFLGPDNERLNISGLSGGIGKKVTSGNQQVIYWPIPNGFSLDGVKVQVNAHPKSKVPWMIVGGGLGVSGGVMLAVLSGWGGDNIVIDTGGGDGGGGGGGKKRHSR